MYVVVEELVPEMAEGKHSNWGTIFFALGFTVMMTLDVALGQRLCRKYEKNVKNVIALIPLQSYNRKCVVKKEYRQQLERSDDKDFC